MPNVLLEAMACGVPCVAPASAGGNALLGGGAGSVPSSNDPEELAEAIGNLIADRGARDRMRELALEEVRRSHSIGPVIDQYESLVDAGTPITPARAGDPQLASGRPAPSDGGSRSEGS